MKKTIWILMAISLMMMPIALADTQIHTCCEKDVCWICEEIEIEEEPITPPISHRIGNDGGVRWGLMVKSIILPVSCSTEESRVDATYEGTFARLLAMIDFQKCIDK